MMIAFLLPAIFQATTDQERIVRIAISLLAIMPLGFLLGFAFPTGMRLVEAIDRQPTPVRGINGATGVLASVLGVMFGMAWGIHVTLTISALCYFLLIPTSFALLGPVRGKRPDQSGCVCRPRAEFHPPFFPTGSAGILAPRDRNCRQCLHFGGSAVRVKKTYLASDDQNVHRKKKAALRAPGPAQPTSVRHCHDGRTS